MGAIEVDNQLHCRTYMQSLPAKYEALVQDNSLKAISWINPGPMNKETVNHYLNVALELIDLRDQIEPLVPIVLKAHNVANIIRHKAVKFSPDRELLTNVINKVTRKK